MEKALSKTEKIDKNEPVRLFIKYLKSESGTYRVFYKKLYGRHAESAQDIQTLTNYVNRGALSPSFIRRVMKAFELEDMTLGELYNWNGEPILDLKQKAQEES